MCSDGTNVNVAAYNLAKEDLGEHCLFILCPAYKLELIVKDALKKSNFNEEVQRDLSDVFFFFFFFFFLMRYIKPVLNK